MMKSSGVPAEERLWRCLGEGTELMVKQGYVSPALRQQLVAELTVRHGLHPPDAWKVEQGLYQQVGNAPAAYTAVGRLMADAPDPPAVTGSWLFGKTPDRAGLRGLEQDRKAQLERLSAPASQVPAGLRCPNPHCRGTRFTFTQVQTRSADEGGTEKATCHACGVVITLER